MLLASSSSTVMNRLCSTESSAWAGAAAGRPAAERSGAWPLEPGLADAGLGGFGSVARSAAGSSCFGSGTSAGATASTVAGCSARASGSGSAGSAGFAAEETSGSGSLVIAGSGLSAAGAGSGWASGRRLRLLLGGRFGFDHRFRRFGGLVAAESAGCRASARVPRRKDRRTSLRERPPLLRLLRRRVPRRARRRPPRALSPRGPDQRATAGPQKSLARARGRRGFGGGSGPGGRAAETLGVLVGFLAEGRGIGVADFLTT